MIAAYIGEYIGQSCDIFISEYAGKNSSKVSSSLFLQSWEYSMGHALFVIHLMYVIRKKRAKKCSLFLVSSNCKILIWQT